MKTPSSFRTAGRTRRAPADVASWCTRFESDCRRRGIRVTPQRLAVYRAVVEDATHPSAEEVHARLHGRMSSLSPATVYRTLEFLEAEGLVRRVSTTESLCRFDANVGTHQHLVCRECGAIRDWQGGAAHFEELGLVEASGFRVQEVDVRLVGICSRCAGESRAE
jgi:Fur family transcriptional regulator, peroxide stress response regulator